MPLLLRVVLCGDKHSRNEVRRRRRSPVCIAVCNVSLDLVLFGATEPNPFGFRSCELGNCEYVISREELQRQTSKSSQAKSWGLLLLRK